MLFPWGGGGVRGYGCGLCRRQKGREGEREKGGGEGRKEVGEREMAIAGEVYSGTFVVVKRFIHPTCLSIMLKGWIVRRGRRSSTKGV